MFNWFDLMRQAQTSAALASLAQQFNLSGDQTQRTMAAFMPAFAMGLQQATVSNDPARLFQTMMSGAYQNFWQAAGHSFSSQAQQEGRRLLDQLFGSDEVSRRVAHQAADYAGISTRDHAAIAAGPRRHPRGRHVALDDGAGARPAESFGSSEEGAKDKAEHANPWAELWAGWMTASAPEKKHANPFEDMMAGALEVMAPPKPQQKEAPPSPSLDLMIEQGREMQMQYLASLQSIFTEAWKANGTKS